MKKLLIINGPNLNLLGQRNREVYGDHTFDAYLTKLKREFEEDIEFDYFQSNIEGEIIDRFHAARGQYDGILLNAGGYTHTSVSIADAVDAMASLGLPTIEVHISSIFAREEFRHVSLLSRCCQGSVMGFGLESYRLAAYHFVQ